MSEYAIQTKALTKRFKDKLAVNGLELSVREGELYALLGVNGAGKTTTIRMLCGLLPPTSGDATLLGYSITTDPAAVRKTLNVSPQETAVAPNLTVLENLELIARIYGSGKHEASQRSSEFIKALDLGEVKNSKAKTLSGGMQRRLSIAMALISKPKILFLDEPTLGLDVIARRELWHTIETLKGKVTIILTTHYMEEAEHLADRIGVMANGQLKAAGTAKELTDLTGTGTLEEAFVTLAGAKEAAI